MKKLFIALLIIITFLFPWYTWSEYLVFELSMVWVYAILILGLNLLTGHNGQVSLGHTAFYAIGAYTAAILIQSYGFNYMLTFPIAAMVGFIAGFLFGFSVRRLDFLYLVLATLALASAVPQLIKRAAAWTGGTQGIVISPLSPPKFIHLSWQNWNYLVTFFIMLLCLLLLKNLMKGRIGRATRAVRDNPLAAAAMGVNVGLNRAITFAISAAFAALAGALLVTVTLFISPDIFDFTFAIYIFIVLVIGGVSNFRGAIIAALFLQFVPSAAADLYKGAPSIIFAILLFLMAYFMPNGVIMGARKLKDRLKELYNDLIYRYKF